MDAYRRSSDYLTTQLNQLLGTQHILVQSPFILTVIARINSLHYRYL